MKAKNYYLIVLALLIILSVILPVVKVGRTTQIKPDLIFASLSLPFLLIIWNYIKRIPLVMSYVVIAISLLISMSLSDSLGKIDFLGGSGFGISIRYIYVFFKIVVFIFFLYLGYSGILSFKLFFRTSAFVFIAAMTWGCLQFFDVGSVKNISISYYAVSDQQKEGIATANRIFGTAPGIISWAGLCIMIFHFFYFVPRGFVIRTLGCALAIVNVLGAASRSAIIALLASFLFIQIFKAAYADRKIVKVFKIVITSFFLLIISYILIKSYFPDRLDFIERRFEAVEADATTTGRGAQLEFFLGVMNSDPINYFLGIGHPVVYSYNFLEIEPVFILVCYGIVGFILHYLLVYLLITSVFKGGKSHINLFLFIVSSSIGYLIFSLGFYFISEIYIGLPFWWLTGFLMGYMYKAAKQQGNFHNLAKKDTYYHNH